MQAKKGLATCGFDKTTRRRRSASGDTIATAHVEYSTDSGIRASRLSGEADYVKNRHGGGKMDGAIGGVGGDGPMRRRGSTFCGRR